MENVKSVKEELRNDAQEVVTSTSARMVALIKQMKSVDIVPVMLRLLAEGKPVPLFHLAERSGHTLQEIKTMLQQITSTEWDEAGRLVGFGLTLRETPHKFIIGGRTLFAWCASDALIFVHIIDHPVRIESRCPITGQIIKIETDHDEIRSVEPREAVVSGVIPSDLPDDVRKEVCQIGHFYSSAEAASEWLKQHPEGRVVTVSQEFEATRKGAKALGWTDVN